MKILDGKIRSMFRNAEEAFHSSFFSVLYSKLLFIIIPPSLLQLRLICKQKTQPAARAEMLGLISSTILMLNVHQALPGIRQRAQFMYDNDEKLLYASFCSSYSLSLIRICLLARHNCEIFSYSSISPSLLHFHSYTYYFFFSFSF